MLKLRIGDALKLFVVLCMLMITGTANAQTKSTLQKIIDEGVINIGVINGFPPWQFTTSSGERSGYETDLARQLAEDLGVKINFVESNGAGRIPNLQAGKVDVVIGALNYTPERAKVVAFTRPYANPVAQFVVKADSRFHTLEDLNSEDVTIGLTVGGVEGEIIPKMLPKAKYVTLTAVADVHQAFLSGRLSATFNETGSMDTDFIGKAPDQFRMIEPPYMKYSTRMAVRYGDYDWWLYLDNWIQNMSYSGKIQIVWEKYMEKGTTALRKD